MSELTVRNVTEDEFTDVLTLFMSAFLNEIADHDHDWFRNEFDPARMHGVFDGDELIGTAAILTRNMTVPGAGQVPFAGVTSVAVKAGHRRRGAMTRMMHAQLHGLHEQGGEPFAALWASEGGIYGRFGYGLASQYYRAVVPKGTAFRSGVAVGKDRVRELTRDEAMPIITAMYDQLAPLRTGWLSRSEKSWTLHLWDTPDRREGASALRFAVHPDGYVIYRTRRKWGDRGPEAELSVEELAATSPVGAAALYRYLLDYDHVAEIVVPIPHDAPLTMMLNDPRQAVRRQSDALWIRLVDVDRALVQRKYSAPLDTVLEVTDVFCPWNQGRWCLTVDSSGTATVERTTRDADLVLDATDLGAVFLGGTRLTELAGAGRVRELTPGALIPASRAFTGDHAPYCPEVF
ncbi:putative acetyltransferase [Kibdelosporangium banguiense]|uniref:Acetyltransferase n=1 Tax=Kibdelosporangium banguiense TaxID=1365924 RepID=A0ABS4T7A0_9PSEU|nr:GNAT family N-acetyltransferase [Kibdelosporangium banguiense]MBP2319809.1 putative acetyltransferase [Kibdelosporangium banguiense]